jgi:hypothetical protein
MGTNLCLVQALEGGVDKNLRLAALSWRGPSCAHRCRAADFDALPVLVVLQVQGRWR